MWWITQFFAIFVVTCVHTFNRWAGVHGWAFLSKLCINIIVQSIAAPLFMISYMMAPSFFQVSFVGTVIIAVLMFLSSVLFFGEVITFVKLIGAVLAIIGAVLLIL
jgi:uncharacterized membrane protein